MEDFAATLIREKLELTEGAGEPKIVRSNRIVLALKGEKKTERIAIRTQNMHMALYTARHVMHSFFRNGTFADRAKPYYWLQHWDETMSAFERLYNTHTWAAVYINGNPVFKTGAVSPYLDIVEKCAQAQPENYEATAGFVEDMLIRAGKPVEILQETNIATVFANMENTTRASVIHRGRGRNMTFNMVVSGGSDEKRIENTLNATAALLEVINVKFTVENIYARFLDGEVEAWSPEFIKLKTGVTHVNELNRLINLFEKTHEVHYRPERPDIIFNDGKPLKMS